MRYILKTKYLSFLLLFTILIGGCAKPSSQGTLPPPPNTETQSTLLGTPSSSTEMVELDTTPYDFQIQIIPNMNKNLMNTLPEGGYILDASSYNDHHFFEYIHDTIYKSTTCMLQQDEDLSILGDYIQYLAPPYDKWVDLQIPYDPSTCWLQEVFVTPEERILFLTSSWNLETETIDYTMHELFQDGRSEILQDHLTEEEKDVAWTGSSPINFPDYYDMYSISQSSKVATCSPSDGKLYYGTGKGIWCYDGTKATQLIDFRENDIALKEMSCLQVTANSFLFLGSFNNKYYLITATKLEEPNHTEKKEIVLSDTFINDILADAIADFNMQSREYRIVTDAPSTSASTEQQEKYKDSVTKSLLKKEGPDILGSYILGQDISRFANNGYLMPLDDYFVGKEQYFFSGALADDMVNGHRYGIPYCMFLNFLMGDSRYLPNKESWNARELMQYVRASGACYLYFPQYPYIQDTAQIYNLFALLNDPSDTTYIDWENGISHLDEEPFKDLLCFVKEYTYDGNLSYEEAGKKIQDGEFALYDTSFSSMNTLLFQEVLFDGNQHYIGNPSVAGKGVTLSTMGLYVNASSTKKDGIYAFFDYLLSDDGQMNNFTVRYPDTLPIRIETYEYMLGTSGEYSEHKNGTFQYMGMDYKYKKLSDKQKKQALELVEHSTPYNPRFREIQSILTEELTPYFLGDKSIEDATKNLHKRVQLYLNE